VINQSYTSDSTTLLVTNTMKIINSLKIDGLVDIIVKWSFKTPGAELDKTLFSVTLELNDGQSTNRKNLEKNVVTQNKALQTIKQSLFKLLKCEIDFWLNEIMIKKILKQKILNISSGSLEPNHNLEQDQRLSLINPTRPLKIKKSEKGKLAGVFA
jgi:hypothetical protein